MIRITTAPAATPEALDPAAMVALLDADASEQSRIQELIQDATRAAEDIACRRLWYREYEERILGDGDDRLYLRARPLATVTSVKIASDDDSLVEGSEADEFSIWSDNGFLFRESGWTYSAHWLCRYYGGYWLPSMTGTKPPEAADISVDGRHIRKAIEQIVQLSYQLDDSDSTVKREKIGGDAPIETEYIEGVWCPKGALLVLRGLATVAP